MSDPNPQALYIRLLDDLSAYLTPYQIELLRSGGEIWPDATLQEASAFSVGLSLLKKFEPRNSHDLNVKALDKFQQANAASGAWCPQPCEVWHQELLGSLKDELYRFWFQGDAPGTSLVSNDEQVLDAGRTGPGSARTARGTDFYTKLFDSPLGCSSSHLYESYRRYCSRFPRWQSAELLRASHYGEATVVRGSRITFVPKNAKIARTICVEPNLNVLFQLGLGAILTARLKSRFGIDLEVQQERNRVLARRGSRRKSDVYSTLDLSSASDSISANMLWHFLPPEFLFWLERYRCKETETPRGWQTLGMISSMGNGYTFPLQTILFAAIVVVVYKSLGINPRFPRGNALGNFGVNGDDIICRRQATDRVTWLLTYLGFSVNDDKSFVKGPFRESCGGDYFNGHPIRGVYIKKMDTPQSRYVAINRIVQFTARTGIFLPRVMQYLTRRVEYLPVPWWEDDAAGIKTLRPSRVGWSKRYQQTTYVAYCASQFGLRVRGEQIISPNTTKRRRVNPDGLYIACLHGSLHRNFIGLRQETKKYRKVRRLVVPSWDHTVAPPLNSEMSLGGLEPHNVCCAMLGYGLT